MPGSDPPADGPFPAEERVEVQGHLIDSGVLARLLDDVIDYGGEYRVEHLALGRTHDDISVATLTVGAPTEEALTRLVNRLQVHGANAVESGEAVVRSVDRDGVFPEDFYSTTNLPTQVRLDGRWVGVDNPEMDCGLVVTAGSPPRVHTVAVSDTRRGMQVVCGTAGVRVVPLSRAADRAAGWGFMNSSVSSEKPQALLVRQIAGQMRSVRDGGQKLLWVAGPAVVHTGAAPAMVRLIRAGWVDTLFAGNALATHDIESALYGTSLGVDLSGGHGVEHGHEHHIRAINSVRRAGSIAAAVEQGLLTSGIMHALVTSGRRYVLVGSVRDDGPLPDVITDVLAGQRAMRAALPGTGFAIMVATMLHSIATGNLLPASVPLACVDINSATVTKLADRGSTQAVGIVTDVGLFLEQLAGELDA